MTIQPELTVDDFAPRRGKPFTVETQSGDVQLLLAGVQELPASGRAGGAFRLEFHGPPRPGLQQGTYWFHVGKRKVGIFIVPLGPLGQALRYEAIFF